MPAVEIGLGYAGKKQSTKQIIAALSALNGQPTRQELTDEFASRLTTELTDKS